MTMSRMAAAGLLLWMSAGAAEELERVKIINAIPDDVKVFPKIAEVRQITHGPKHHFFGYYGILPWDATGRYLVCLESDFGDRLVEAGNVATIVLIDLEKGTLKPVGETSSWNFQQGALIHWLGTAPDRKIIYNDQVDGALKSVVLDVFSAEKRVLPRAIAAASHNGKWAASINYARLRTTRPGYGYAGVDDPFADEMHPKEDGLYLMDVETGVVKLITSMDQVFALEPAPEPYRGNKMWFNHVVFSRDDKRLFFLARYRPTAPGPLITAAFTVNTDGTGLRCVLPYSWGASHFDWLDGKHMAVTSQFKGQRGKWLHVFFEDGAALETYEVLAPEVLPRDGHCHFSYDGKWMLTDSYPIGKERMRHFYIMDLASRKAALMAAFHEPKRFNGEWRCDLHPRWSKDGTQVCIDSTQDDSRQVYILDLEFPEGE